jgi:predicted amidophosphoribosyltransferase
MLAGVERWLLPAECLLCQDPIGAGQGDPLICALCRSRWERLPDPCCDRCGQPRLLPEVACRLCTGWPAVPGRVRSAVWLDGGARAAVHQAKYEGWWRATESMARVMTGLTPLTGPLFLVPVPLGHCRRRERGYNQSACLARALGRLLELRVCEDVLVRTRETPTQTSLPPEARLANVTGAFLARELPPGRAVLVDDVCTTGATLVSAALALEAAGAPAVDAVTFARARLQVDEAR